MLGGLLISSLRGSILLVPAHNPSSSRIAMLTAASTPFAAASGSLPTCFCLPFFSSLCPNTSHCFPQLQPLVSPPPDPRAAKSHYVDRKQPIISHSETKPGFSGCGCLELGRWG